jgi:hypothetical protein
MVVALRPSRDFSLEARDVTCSERLRSADTVPNLEGIKVALPIHSKSWPYWRVAGDDLQDGYRGFPPLYDGTESRPARDRPSGVVATGDSRRHRKSNNGRGAGPRGTWWSPRSPGWWIGVLFAVGAALFALGAVPGYVDLLGARVDSITFFVGSLFFTTAAFLQYRESVTSGAQGVPHGWGRVFFFGSRQIDWWAGIIQLIGTLFFNVSTANAVRIDLSASAALHHVWRPDALGSACFLVASGLAWFEVCHGWGSWSPRDLSWWITLLNLVGSVAFGVSAVAAYIVPTTGQLWNVELTNLGTFVGALCFLAGAILLFPERTLASDTQDR